jgi:hypothetical protein
VTMPTATLLERAHDGPVGEDDPAAKPRRRSFSADYKLGILAEYSPVRSTKQFPPGAPPWHRMNLRFQNGA